MSRAFVKQESIAKLLDDQGRALIKLHYEEVEDQRAPLDLDYNAYMQMEQFGFLDTFTARKDNRLVGYLTYITTPALHNKTTRCAMCDMFYVLPSSRGEFLGNKLLRFAEAVLKDKGIEYTVVNTKITHDFKPILERLGFKATETQYTKRLGD